jgi:hypothetical protein
LPDGPHDVEFFLDAGCPFAWQTSRWLLRVASLRDRASVALHLAEGGQRGEGSPTLLSVQGERRVGPSGAPHGAAVDKVGNDGSAAGTPCGERLWNTERNGRDFCEPAETIAEGLRRAVGRADLPVELAEAADNDSYDELLRNETEVALDRPVPTSTPITYGQGGPTYFGPVISSVPDDDADVRCTTPSRPSASSAGPSRS